MKKKGHIAVGALFLLPVLFNKSIPYINTSDQYLIKLNNIILYFNNNFITLSNLLYNLTFNPAQLILLLLFYYFGIRFPDMDLYIKNISPYLKEHRYLYHRQLTHSLFLNLFIMFYFYKNIYVFFFSYGLLTHLIADMFTGSIPLFLFGKYYRTFNIFQWRIGIDLLYILIKPKYYKGNTKLQLIINNIKDFIVDTFDNLSKIIVLIVILMYVLKYFQLI